MLDNNDDGHHHDTMTRKMHRRLAGWSKPQLVPGMQEECAGRRPRRRDQRRRGRPQRRGGLTHGTAGLELMEGRRGGAVWWFTFLPGNFSSFPYLVVFIEHSPYNFLLCTKTSHLWIFLERGSQRENSCSGNVLSGGGGWWAVEGRGQDIYFHNYGVTYLCCDWVKVWISPAVPPALPFGGGKRLALGFFFAEKFARSRTV